MDLTRYTSYETSVALRDAGMDPHGLPGKHSWWWRNDVMKYPLLEALDVPFQGAVRSWRLDELIEQLAKACLLQFKDGWACVAEGLPMDVQCEAASPVEAAAACLLAVMRAKS